MTGIGKLRSDAEAIIRSVSSVTFGIGGADPFDRTVRAAVSWMRARNAGVPSDAEDLRPFDVGGGGAPVARAVFLPIEGGRIWSAAIDDPDSSHIGRIWITEITVAEANGDVHFGVRLLNFTRGVDKPFAPSIPRLVRDIIAELPCFADGELLRDDANVVETTEEVDALVALLEKQDRRLPVVVLAEGVSRAPFAALETLTRRLAGAAHVFGVSDRCTWLLKARLGQSLSVFDGAVRIYRPGLRVEDADPYAHPLWLARPGRPSADGGPVIVRVLASGIAKGTKDYPRFESVRQVAAEQSIDQHRAGASADEMAALYEAQNQALRDQLANLRDEQNQWLADAEAERARAEQQIAELRAEIHRARAQNETLRSVVRSGEASPSTRQPLEDFADIETWAETNLSPGIWLSPKAIKETERHGRYRDPVEFGEALYALDELYAPMRRDPNGERHQLWQDRLTELGMTMTSCFVRAGDIQRFPEYAVHYRGQRRWCDLHLRRGGGTDPRSMFRIYVHWDEDEGVLLVGHMPSHLDNNMTN